MDQTIIRETEEFALHIRLGIMRQLTHLGFGHAGGSLSMADLVAVLYNGALKIDPQNPKMEERDRLVVSKGHAGPALYAALALKGYFPKEWLFTLNQGGSNLPSHCDANKTPGIDVVTGSLGQGLSIGIGMAYAFRLDGKPNYVYAVLGDGECQEGQIWEAAMAAPKYKLDRLIGIIDYNKYQLDGAIEDIMPLSSLKAKFEAFGWNVMQVDGHNVGTLFDTIEKAKQTKGKPTMLLLDTIKGKGCSEMEKLKHKSHHLSISKEMGERCIGELEARLSKPKGGA